MPDNRASLAKLDMLDHTINGFHQGGTHMRFAGRGMMRESYYVRQGDWIGRKAVAIVLLLGP